MGRKRQKQIRSKTAYLYLTLGIAQQVIIQGKSKHHNKDQLPQINSHQPYFTENTQSQDPLILQSLDPIRDFNQGQQNKKTPLLNENNEAFHENSSFEQEFPEFQEELRQKQSQEELNVQSSDYSEMNANDFSFHETSKQENNNSQHQSDNEKEEKTIKCQQKLEQIDPEISNDNEENDYISQKQNSEKTQQLQNSTLKKNFNEEQNIEYQHFQNPAKSNKKLDQLEFQQTSDQSFSNQVQQQPNFSNEQSNFNEEQTHLGVQQETSIAENLSQQQSSRTSQDLTSENTPQQQISTEELQKQLNTNQQNDKTYSSHEPQNQDKSKEEGQNLNLEESKLESYSSEKHKLDQSKIISNQNNSLEIDPLSDAVFQSKPCLQISNDYENTQDENQQFQQTQQSNFQEKQKKGEITKKEQRKFQNQVPIYSSCEKLQKHQFQQKELSQDHQNQEPQKVIEKDFDADNISQPYQQENQLNQNETNQNTLNQESFQDKTDLSHKSEDKNEIQDILNERVFKSFSVLESQGNILNENEMQDQIQDNQNFTQNQDTKNRMIKSQPYVSKAINEDAFIQEEKNRKQNQENEAQNLECKALQIEEEQEDQDCIECQEKMKDQPEHNTLNQENQEKENKDFEQVQFQFIISNLEEQSQKEKEQEKLIKIITKKTLEITNYDVLNEKIFSSENSFEKKIQNTESKSQADKSSFQSCEQENEQNSDYFSDEPSNEKNKGEKISEIVFDSKEIITIQQQITISP